MLKCLHHFDSVLWASEQDPNVSRSNTIYLSVAISCYFSRQTYPCLFQWLNNARSSQAPLARPELQMPTALVTLCYTCHSRCGLISAEKMRWISSPNLLTTLLLTQVRTWLALFVARYMPTDGELLVHGDHQVLFFKAVSSHSASSLSSCVSLFCPGSKTLRLPFGNFIKSPRAHFCLGLHK